MEKILNYEILKVGNDAIYLASILKLVGFLLLIFIAILILKKAVYKSSRFDIAKKYSIYSLSKYFIYVLASIYGLQIVGFNVSVLLAGSAALLVGVGLGLQSIFSDFISGILILIESTVKVNDVIEVNGVVCVVKEINLRTTTVLTRDDKYIILPNSNLTTSQIVNWTHENISSRFEVLVGVDYSSDVDLVMEILKKVVLTQDGVQKEPAPFVRFINFGDSSLDFSVVFWSEEVFRVRNIQSELRVKIFNAFKENNISIPFPQRVVHIKNQE
ncbi:MAG: mechanosensitive ion channel domain-containing protein [Flavobacterium sp.]